MMWSGNMRLAEIVFHNTVQEAPLVNNDMKQGKKGIIV